MRKAGKLNELLESAAGQGDAYIVQPRSRTFAAWKPPTSPADNAANEPT